MMMVPMITMTMITMMVALTVIVTRVGMNS
jgi:hypothetical protein